MKKMLKMIVLGSLVGFFLMLSACGNKGPLYIPDQSLSIKTQVIG